MRRHLALLLGLAGCARAHVPAPAVVAPVAPAAPVDAPVARDVPTPIGDWQRGDAARALLAPWDHCPDVVGDDPEARATDRGVELRMFSSGSGRWAVFRDDHAFLARGSCEADLGYTLTGGLESSIVGVQAEAASAAHVAALAGAEPVRDVDRDAFAAARLLVVIEQDHAAAPAEDELGAPWPIQPAHPGPPRGSPPAYWDRAAIVAAGIATPELADDDGVRIGLLTRALATPTKLVTHGRFELWELRLRSRLGGALLAVHDRARDRSTWVFGTQLDDRRVGHLRIVAATHALVLVRAGEGADERVFAIDLERAITRPYGWIDGTRARAQGDAIAIAPPGGPSRLLRASDL